MDSVPGTFTRKKAGHREAREAGMDEKQTTEAQWRARLTPRPYRVLRQSGTERAFTGQYVDCHDDGVYRCAACAAPLFSSAAKFDSGTGWPSFTEPAMADAVTLHKDRGFLFSRTEVRCRSCGSHLGHVFGDGPRPTGQRWCINSCALDLAARAAGSPSATATAGGQDPAPEESP
jgi:peptide-methionine (R)-S-oxide reductase